MTIEEITNIIAKNIDLAVKTLKDSGGISADFSYVVEAERMFVEETSIAPEKAYFVVKFGKGTYNFALADIPATIEAVSEADTLDEMQLVLRTMIATVNYVYKDSMIQSWLLPETTDSFSDVGDSFRSLVFAQGDIRVPNSAVWQIVELDLFSGTADYPIPFISAKLDYSTTADPQAFYGGTGLTKNINKQATRSLTITTYMENSNALSTSLKATLNGSGNINEKFTLKAKMQDGNWLANASYNLVSFTMPQQLGTVPLISLVFTEAQSN